MIAPAGRARLSGGLLAIAAFGLGIAVGARFFPRPAPVRMLTVTATNDVPAELLALHLSDVQRQRLGPILVRGRDRIVRVIDRFTPAVQMSVDSTDAEIREILTERQRMLFDSIRAENPTLRRVIRKE